MSQRARSRLPADIESRASNWILRRDAGLTVEEQAEFERWRAEDPSHAEAVARKDKAWSALDRPIHSGQADLLLARLEARAATRRRRRLGAAVTGIAVLFVAATFLQWHRMPSPAQPEARRAVVHLPEQQMLPDGSVVELRPGAEVAVDYGGTLRRVTLVKGEAHFLVTKNSDRAFVVAVGGVEVRAVGTSFAVQRGQTAIELIVIEGSVAVDNVAGSSSSTGDGQPAAIASANNDRMAEPQTLATVDAGRRMVVELSARPSASPPIAMSPEEMTGRLAWRATRLEFSDLPLREAVALMNRYNKVQFVIEDAALARLGISGLFRADNIDTFVRLLEGTCGIAAERSGDTILLKKALR
ncbi:MAG: FecR family protein [Opitutaceae bacterium]